MPKKAYVGVNDIARKVKKMYVGVDGIARKVKKGYIGVNGIAQLFFSGGELRYYGLATPLSQARDSLAATTVGNYALLGGGKSGSSTSHSTVDAYDKSLTRTTPAALSEARDSLAATTVGNYALFGGGAYYYRQMYVITYYTSTVDAYDKSLTRTTPAALSEARYGLAATTVGNYALFGGGHCGSIGYMNTVDAYDESLTHTTPTTLSEVRSELAATTLGDYALFGGGKGFHMVGNGGAGTILNTVDAYDKSLTRTTITALSEARHDLAATTVGDYALFAGGSYTNNLNKIVDAYDKSLTRTTITALSVARSNLAATTVGDYALFGGGDTDNNGTTGLATVDAYDKSLTRIIPTQMSAGKVLHAATTIGNYALFGGGYNGNQEDSNVVEVYTID